MSLRLLTPRPVPRLRPQLRARSSLTKGMSAERNPVDVDQLLENTHNAYVASLARTATATTMPRADDLKEPLLKDVDALISTIRNKYLSVNPDPVGKISTVPPSPQRRRPVTEFPSKDSLKNLPELDRSDSGPQFRFVASRQPVAPSSSAFFWENYQRSRLIVDAACFPAGPSMRWSSDKTINTAILLNRLRLMMLQPGSKDAEVIVVTESRPPNATPSRGLRILTVPDAMGAEEFVYAVVMRLASGRNVSGRLIKGRSSMAKPVIFTNNERLIFRLRNAATIGENWSIWSAMNVHYLSLLDQVCSLPLPIDGEAGDRQENQEAKTELAGPDMETEPRTEARKSAKS